MQQLLLASVDRLMNENLTPIVADIVKIELQKALEFPPKQQ